jgi:hypothetical protein
MYMPLQNYKDLEPDFLMNYWSQDKDILGVTNFGDLVPEVIWLGSDYEKTLLELIGIRIEYKRNKYQGRKLDTAIKDQILARKKLLRVQAEQEINNRLEAIRFYLRNPVRDPHLSFEEIFKKKESKTSNMVHPLFKFVKDKLMRPDKWVNEDPSNTR